MHKNLYWVPVYKLDEYPMVDTDKAIVRKIEMEYFDRCYLNWMGYYGRCLVGGS